MISLILITGFIRTPRVIPRFIDNRLKTGSNVGGGGVDVGGGGDGG